MPTDVMTIPEGTVTLLSTDLVGYTLLNQALGDEASATIEREIKTLALEQMAMHGGTVIKETGDGLSDPQSRRILGPARVLVLERLKY